MGRRRESVFDVVVGYNLLVQHVLAGRLPIPPPPAIREVLGIFGNVENFNVLIHKVIISQRAVFELLDCINGGEYRQRFLVVLQGRAPASHRINLQCGRVGRQSQLLHRLPWFWTVVKSSIYGGIKDAGQRVVLKRRQTLQVTFVRMAVRAQRHELLLTVAIVAQGDRMVKFQVVRKFVASIPAYLTLVTKFFQDGEPFGARYFFTLVFFLPKP